MSLLQRSVAFEFQGVCSRDSRVRKGSGGLWHCSEEFRDVGRNYGRVGGADGGDVLLECGRSFERLRYKSEEGLGGRRGFGRLGGAEGEDGGRVDSAVVVLLLFSGLESGRILSV